MFARLFLLFTSVSLLEIFVLVKVGSFLGAFATVCLVVITALIGSALVRSQGLQLLQEWQRRLAQGEMPGEQLIEGVMLLMTGVLLVTPGFVTDFAGLLLLQPAIRKRIAIMVMANITFPRNGTMNSTGSQWKQKSCEEDVIEGEFERKDDQK